MSERTVEEQQFLNDSNAHRKRCGEPPMTVEQENLYLSQAGTLGEVVTSQPTGQAFMAALRPLRTLERKPKVEPKPPEPA